MDLNSMYEPAWKTQYSSCNERERRLNIQATMMMNAITCPSSSLYLTLQKNEANSASHLPHPLSRDSGCSGGGSRVIMIGLF